MKIEGWSIVLRCDASPEIGFGHLTRSLALARELVDRGGKVTFAIVRGPQAVALVEREGYAVRNRIDAGPQPHALVLEVRDETPRSDIDVLRARGVLIATIDDPTSRRLSADLAFYPPIPQIEAFGWEGFAGTRLVGGEWVVLRRTFAEPPVRDMRPRPTVLVTMGGSDPAGMTVTAIEALATMSEAFDVTVVLGPGFRDRKRLTDRLRTLSHSVVVYEQPSDMRAVMLGADLAVASFGVTAYELAATATPAVYLCLTDDHARSAASLAQAGAAVVLGVYTGSEGPGIAAAVRTLVMDNDRRDVMGRAGRLLIDGRGAARVADRIIKELETRR